MALDLDQIRQLLKEAGYEEYDLADDSVIMDLLGKAFLILAKPLEDQIEFVKNAQSIENYATMEEWQMDQLIANVFIKRRGGSRAKTTIRMYFTNPQAIDIKKDEIYFYTKEGLKFFPQDNYSFTQPLFSTVEINGYRYFSVDIPVIAEEEGDQYNIKAGEIRYTNFKNSFFSHVENLQDAEGGIFKETNEQVVTSAKRAIATRDNVTKDAIYTVFTQRFPQIIDLSAIGYLDPEMQRDITRLSACWNGHMGGAVDVYVKVPLTFYSESVKALPSDYEDPDGVDYKIPGVQYQNLIVYDETTFETGNIVKIVSRNQAWYDYQWRNYNDILALTGSPYWVDIENNPGDSLFYFKSPVVYGLKFYHGTEELPIVAKKIYHMHNQYSIREAVDYWVQLPDGVNYDPNNPLEIRVEYWSSVNDLEQFQSAILEPAMRPIVADILFKNFIPIIIKEVKITYSGKELIYNEVEKALKDFLYYRIDKSPLYASEIIKKILEPSLLPEVGERTPQSISQDTILTTPMRISYRQLHIDGTETYTQTTNVIEPLDAPLLSSSERTVSLYIKKDFLSLSKEE